MTLRTGDVNADGVVGTRDLKEIKMHLGRGLVGGDDFRDDITVDGKVNHGDTTLENLDRGPGHCDIVVEIRPGEVHAIGGNVADSVTRSVFPLDESGFLSPISARRFFTVIENRLP